MKLHHVPKLYFLHIPKTAGTSFRLWLERLFGVDDVLVMDHLAELQSADGALLQEKSLFSGHFGWYMMERAVELKMNVEPLTILREPKALYRSGWRFADLIPEEDAVKLGGAREAMDALVDMIRRGERPSRNPDGGNMCTRYLAHWGTEVQTPVKIDGDMLELAKMRLRRMKFFGFVEDWERTAILFAYAYKLPLREIDLVVNATAGARQVELPKEVDDLLAEDNRYDFELYDFGRTLFDERFAAAAADLGLSPTARASEFRQPLLERFMAAPAVVRKVTLVSNESLPVSDGIVAEGFQYRYQAQSGEWQLWAGPERKSVLYLPLDRTLDLELTFDFKVFMNRNIQDHLRVFIDGCAVELERDYLQDVDGQYYTVGRFVVPKRNPSSRFSAYTAVRFEVPEMVQVNIAEFPNPISFAVSGEIAIRPASSAMSSLRAAAETVKVMFGRND